MADTAVSFVVDHLVPLLVQEAKFLAGVRQGVTEIKDELEGMKAFLKDADTRQHSDEGIKVWVKQVRDIAFDTEDVVDEFLLRMGRHYGPGFQAFLRRCARSIKQLRARHRLGTQIRDIKNRIRALVERRAAFSLTTRATDEGTSSSSSTTGDRLAALYTDDSELVGIDNPRDELIRRVVEGGSRLAVIPVVGMGGLGKTTLVRKTYEAVRTRVPFDCCAWITVSQEFRTEDLFRSMIRKLYEAVEKPLPKGIDTMDADHLVGTLRAYLQGKRYVVVFDDVWSVDAWKVIDVALPKDECCSRVMVTTRSHDVASSCCTQNHGDDHVYRMPTLEPEEAWKLFCKKAFRSNSTCPVELEATSRRIVGKCEGLPLAIQAIGGLLSRRSKTPSEWETVYHALSTAAGMESSTDEALSNMRKILWLSYDALPYHLRSCFLYFGLFPEDHNVKRSQLTRQWVAEGFIRWNTGTRPPPEAIAEERLNELVARNLIQVVEMDRYGRVDECRIHDLLRELVLSKAREENFCTFLAQEVDNIGSDEKPPRRLSVYKREQLRESTDEYLSHLRTLSVFGVGEEAPLLSRFRLLRVLTLEDVDLETFPCEITNLLHLSYLSMRGTNIRVVPDSIGKLGNLQTLDLKDTHVSELPRGVLKLQKLRHLLIAGFFINDGVRMPAGIGGLRDLQKLAMLEVNGKEQIEELGNLNQLTRLSLTEVREGDGEALCGSIKKMHHLQSLTIASVNNGAEQLDVQSLSSTTVLPLLRSITLRGRLEKLPEVIASSQSLVKIGLWSSGLRDDPLRALQSLPNLVDLFIGREAYDGQALRCEAGGFPRLGRLSINELDGLSSITFERGSMPNLAELRVRRCGGLREVPFGIEHLTTLRELFVSEMPQEFTDSIQKNKGKDWGKVMHIPIITCGLWIGDGVRFESLSN